MLGYHKDFSAFGFLSVTVFCIASILVNLLLFILACVYLGMHSTEGYKEDMAHKNKMKMEMEKKKKDMHHMHHMPKTSV